MTPADPSPAREGCASDTPEADRALRWLHRSAAEAELIGLVDARVKRRRRRRLALVATACGLLVGAGVAWRTASGSRPGDAVRVAEAGTTATVTAPRRQILPDGTEVEFREGAEISQAFSAGFRRVTLLRGEAHFQVTKDSQRPFIVSAQGVEVRAVGTAFSVQLDAAAVEVVVTEGRVAVDRAPDPGPAPTPRGKPGSDGGVVGASGDASAGSAPAAVLEAGHRAWIGLAETVPTVSSLPEAELARRLAWRVPQLEFSRTRLAEILVLMNRYAAERGRTAIMIEPASGDLGELKLSGYLAADNVEGLIRLLESGFQVRAETTADALVLRRAR